MPYGALSYPDFLDLVEAGGERMKVVGSGQGLFGASVRHETLTEVAFGQVVTGSFFPALQVEMSAGRGLLPDDDRPGAPPAVRVVTASVPAEAAPVGWGAHGLVFVAELGTQKAMFLLPEEGGAPRRLSTPGLVI